MINSKYDIAIIGAGIAGATLASRLNEGQSVCILDAEKTSAYHSTGRSAAMFIKNYGNVPIRHLTQLSESFFRNPKLLFCQQDLLHQRGELVFCQPNQEALWHKKLKEFSEVAEISAQQAHELVPLLKKEKVVCAVYDELAADIDVDLFHQSALKQAKKNGAEVLLNHQVMALKKKANFWRITVMTEGRIEKIIEAKTIVNAAGAWAANIAAMAGARDQLLQPMRRSAAIISPPKEYFKDDGPLFMPVEGNWYAKPQSGQLMVSPSEEIPVEAHDAYVDDMIMAEGLHRFQCCVNMTVERLEHQWAGLRTFTSDRTPVMGFDGDVDDFFWLAGQGGYGIQTAPALSNLAADTLQNNHDDDVTELLKQLSPTRKQSSE